MHVLVTSSAPEVGGARYTGMDKQYFAHSQLIKI